MHAFGSDLLPGDTCEVVSRLSVSSSCASLSGCLRVPISYEWILWFAKCHPWLCEGRSCKFAGGGQQTVSRCSVSRRPSRRGSGRAARRAELPGGMGGLPCRPGARACARRGSGSSAASPPGRPRALRRRPRRTPRTRRASTAARACAGRATSARAARAPPARRASTSRRPRTRSAGTAARPPPRARQGRRAGGSAAAPRAATSRRPL